MDSAASRLFPGYGKEFVDVDDGIKRSDTLGSAEGPKNNYHTPRNDQQDESLFALADDIGWCEQFNLGYEPQLAFNCYCCDFG